MRFPRPFEENYGLTVTIAILAITPFIFVTTASQIIEQRVAADVGTNLTGISVLSGLAIAGYAFGALLAGDLIQRFPQRRLFFICEALFIAGCAVAASGRDLVMFGAGEVLVGFATGLLLVIALPPVVQRFPASRMPTTSAVINIGFFGAVTAGPLLGGAVSLADSWRALWIGIGAMGVLAYFLAALTLPDKPPPKPDARFDKSAIVLSFFGTVLPFWASGELVGHGFGSWLFIAPLAVGTIAFVALLLVQYHQKEPLSPVKPMWKTIPLTGVLVAMFGGGILITLLELGEQFGMQVLPLTELQVGLLFWPSVLATIVAALALGALINSRYLPLLALGGMLALIAAAALMVFMPAEGAALHLLIVAGLLGLGAGATVSPGLWLTGFSLPSTMVGRIFALVELVRSEADFIMAPVILQFARGVSIGVTITADGVREAAFVTLIIAIVATAGMVAIWLTGGVKLPAPDLEGWLDKNQLERVALPSPPLGAALVSSGRRRLEQRSRS